MVDDQSKRDPLARPRPSKTDDALIRQTLQKYCRDLGALPHEEIHWVFLPKDNKSNPREFVLGKSGKDDPISKVRYEEIVVQKFSPEDLKVLFDQMAESAWTLNIHNHPESTTPGERSLCGPSFQDCETAFGWLVENPEATQRLLFFVVKESCAVEYMLPKGDIVWWLGQPSVTG